MKKAEPKSLAETHNGIEMILKRKQTQHMRQTQKLFIAIDQR